MPVEAATYINDLNISNPTGTDSRSAGDDHLRLIKSVLKNTFPDIDVEIRFKSLPVGTRSDVETISIPSVAQHIRTSGYSSTDDGGGALYQRVDSEPAHAGKVQSADGAWWEIVAEHDIVSAAQFGGDTSVASTVATALGATVFNHANDLTRLSTAETDIDTAETRLDTAETDIDALEAADVALDSRVDALEAGYKFLGSVDFATTANITLSGEQTIDGETTSTSTGLVKDQTDASENGVYTTASGAWTRIAALDADDDITTPVEVYVTAGTENGGKSFRTTVAGITLGTDDMPWAESSASNTGVQDQIDALDTRTDGIDQSEGSGFHEFRAADGSVVLRLDENGALGPVVGGREVVGENDDGTVTVTIKGEADTPARLDVEAADGGRLGEIGFSGAWWHSLRSDRISSSRDRTRGLLTAQAIPAIVASSQGLAQVNHIILLGRSLADGRGTIRHTAQHRNIAALGTNADAADDSIIDAVTGWAPGDARSVQELFEQYRFMAADHCMTLVERLKGIDADSLDCQWLTSEAAIGGTNLAGLQEWTLDDVEGQISTAKALCDARGLSYRFAGFLFSHGDDTPGSGTAPNEAAADGTAYETALGDYLAAVRAKVAAETGQTGACVPVFILAKKTTGPFATYAEWAKAQTRYAVGDEWTFAIGSNHPLETMTAEGGSADDIHLSGYGTVEGGIVFGRAFYRHFFEGRDPTGLFPVACWADGADVFVRLNRRILTTRTESGNGTAFHWTPSNLGLAVSDKPIGAVFDAGTHTTRTISATSIVGDDTIKITLSAAPSAGDVVSCGGSSVSHELNEDVYGDSANAVDFTPYEILMPFDMEITNA